MRLALAIALMFAAADHPADSVQAYRGYTAQNAAAEAGWESKFRDIPDRDRMRENMRRLSARPHHVGSPYDKDNAEWLLVQLKSYGLEAQIEVFSTLFPTPKSRLLELQGPAPFKAKLQEPALSVDPTSSQASEQLPTYNAYSHDGDVTAPLVYVNFGRPEDYEVLARNGVSVQGAIVLARYGASWRGIKPKVASEHGAVGCIIFSDPADDGYGDGDPFPAGPSRPADGVQRGSVMDMTLYPGDPQTPGIGAVEGAKLIPLDQVQTITKIPVFPISYADATPLLKALRGVPAPLDWRGGLPVTYRLGPSTANVHLALSFNWDRKPLYDVIVHIPGAKYPDQWVVRGNHHDAWVNGAEDPISGTSPELEEARALGELLKQGWKPQRTIIYCFWDGEEPALLGSTEWGEAHADELKQHAAVYINTDANDRGYLQVGGSHSLENFVNEVAPEIADPETKMNVWKREKLASIAQAKGKDREELRSRPDMRIEALGSGSDFTVFLQHLGIATLNLGYGGEGEGGQYHSIYDDFYWYTHYSDGDFIYGRALAQTVGTMVLRLADADMIPFQFSDLAETVHKYVTELKGLETDKRDEARERNRELEEGVYDALRDPQKTLVAPPREEIPPHLNFAPLDQAADELTEAAEAFDKAFNAAAGNASPELNNDLLRAERVLTDDQGLPNRPWFKHVLYAPGFYTGYGVKTMPGVREAIEQKRWAEADQEIKRTATALEQEVDLLKKATERLHSKSADAGR